MRAYMVQAAQGDYDEKSWWAVAIWSAEALAVEHAARLNWCARQLAEALRADPAPTNREDFEPSASVSAYDRWQKRRAKLLRKWRRLSGDPLLEEYHQPAYSVTPLPFFTRRSKA